MRWLDYKFGPKVRSGDNGRLGEPMLSVRQVFMLPAVLVYGLSVIVAAPLLLAEPVRKWQLPFIWVSGFLGAIAVAWADMVRGIRPSFDFRYQCSLLDWR